MNTHPKLALFVWLLAGSLLVPGTAVAHESVDEMAQAARNFLQALTPEQKETATFEFSTDERMNWHFIPRDRKGLSLGDMTTEQRQLAHALLATGLSQRGYVKAVTVMSLEQVLQDLEGGNRRFSRDPALYFFSIFGKPADEGTWGWRVEGHHLSINFTMVNGHHVSGTPSFFGANPAKVPSGPRQGLRVLADEEDLGRALMKSLSAGQKKAAMISTTAPRDIITGADRTVQPLEKAGLTADRLNSDQTKQLKSLVETYLYRNRPDVADEAMARIDEAGWNEVRFAWAGGLESGEGHYYRVQGPTFLLEYDNTQNDANHIHSVWRDFDGDFGLDLLRQHYDHDAHRD